MKFEVGPDLKAMRLPVLLLVLVAAANVLLLFTVTVPTWNRASAVGSAGLVSAQAHAALEPQLDRARRMFGRVADAEAGLVALRQRVGDGSGSVADVVSTLRAAVDAAGIQAEHITYETQPVPELGLTQLQVNLPVRGDYRTLRRFLDELLDGPMFVVLERVSASTPAQNDATGQLLVGVAASVFLDPASAAQLSTSLDEAVPVAAATTDLRAQPSADGPALTRQIDALAQRLRALPANPLGDGAFALALTRLDQPADAAPPSRRDLFSFAEPRARRRSDEAAPVRVDNFTPDPVLPYRLIGVNRTSTGLLATLVDGDLVLVVSEGDLLPDGYRVATIEAMRITLESGNRTSTISLRRDGER